MVKTALELCRFFVDPWLAAVGDLGSRKKNCDSVLHGVFGKRNFRAAKRLNLIVDCTKDMSYLISAKVRVK